MTANSVIYAHFICILDRGLPEVVQNFDDVFLAEVNNCKYY